MCCPSPNVVNCGFGRGAGRGVGVGLGAVDFGAVDFGAVGCAFRLTTCVGDGEVLACDAGADADGLDAGGADTCLLPPPPRAAAPITVPATIAATTPPTA